MTLILASTSQIRYELLQQANIDFVAIPSTFDEESAKKDFANSPPHNVLSHHDQALKLAAGKAQAVSELHMNDYVIGADQICADDARIYSKPLTSSQAKQHLQYLQGREHRQHSAACLFYAGEKIWQHCEIVTLTMRNLTEAEITAYVEKDQPFQACGGYCYEKSGSALFSSVDGSEYAIKGLPMQHLLAALQQFYPISLAKYPAKSS